MARTETTRRRYCRVGLRCASNLTDVEWALIAPFMSAPRGKFVGIDYALVMMACELARRIYSASAAG